MTDLGAQLGRHLGEQLVLEHPVLLDKEVVEEDLAEDNRVQYED